MPFLETVLLCFMHFGFLAFLLLCSYGWGRSLIGRIGPLHTLPARKLLTLILGLGVLGAAVLIIGLVGACWPTFESRPFRYGIAAILAMGAVLAAFQLRRLFSQQCSAVWWPAIVLNFTRLEISLLIVCAFFAINVILGALAPDTAQDSLWYHLSVPRAWLHWGRTRAWPEVFPSNTPLHHCALYAAALLIGNEIDCSLLYAAQGFLCLFVVSLFTSRWYGRTASMWAWFLVATTMGANCWFVPIHSGSDLTVAMFASAGLLLGIDLLYNADSPQLHRRAFVLPNLLIGFAIVSKITALGYAFAPWLLLCLWECWKQPALRRSLLIGLPISMLPLACWGLRSILLGCGNPFFPLFRDHWPIVRNEFAPVSQYSGLNATYALSWFGLKTALSEIPHKLHMAVLSGSPGFVLHALSIVGFKFRDRKLRALALIAALQWLVFLSSAGATEIIRYFAPFYCVPLVAIAVALAAAPTLPVSRTLSRALTLSAVVVMAAMYAQKQWSWSRIPINAWHYTPVLRQEDRNDYITSKSYGLANLPLYDWINNNTPADACVFFAETSYPFYVNRACYWADPDLFFAKLIERNCTNPLDLARNLMRRHITHVLASPFTAERPLWKPLLSEVVDAPSPAGLVLYKVLAQEPE